MPQFKYSTPKALRVILYILIFAFCIAFIFGHKFLYTQIILWAMYAVVAASIIYQLVSEHKAQTLTKARLWGSIIKLVTAGVMVALEQVVATASPT